tara:strand:+ start:658 stop:999 length:342 start_codon:yes stop_codon:yes gene_type:complete
MSMDFQPVFTWDLPKETSLPFHTDTDTEPCLWPPLTVDWWAKRELHLDRIMACEDHWDSERRAGLLVGPTQPYQEFELLLGNKWHRARNIDRDTAELVETGQRFTSPFQWRAL